MELFLQNIRNLFASLIGIKIHKIKLLLPLLQKNTYNSAAHFWNHHANRKYEKCPEEKYLIYNNMQNVMCKVFGRMFGSKDILSSELRG